MIFLGFEKEHFNHLAFRPKQPRLNSGRLTDDERTTGMPW